MNPYLHALILHFNDLMLAHRVSLHGMVLSEAWRHLSFSLEAKIYILF
jgi:hypothetical protein